MVALGFLSNAEVRVICVQRFYIHAALRRNDDAIAIPNDGPLARQGPCERAPAVAYSWLLVAPPSLNSGLV